MSRGKIAEQEMSDSVRNKLENLPTNTNLIVSGINQRLDEIEDNQALFSILKSSKDSNGIFTIITYKRKADGTNYAVSELSGGTSPLYTTRTITYFEEDGVRIKNTIVFALTYDTDGQVISEV